MKRALTILALAALPVFADEPAKTTTATQAAPATAATRPQTISAAPATPADSPMVAAARRSKRGKKSAHSITNANLGTYGKKAHVTTTARQEPIVMPEPLPPSAPTAEMKHAAERAEARKAAEVEAEKKKKEEEKRKAKTAAAAERNEEGMYGETDADAGFSENDARKPERPKEEKPPQR